MGKQSRARHAAKRRQERARRGAERPAGGGYFSAPPRMGGPAPAIEELVAAALYLVADGAEASEQADRLTRTGAAAARLTDVLERVLARLVDDAFHHGWTPLDLSETCRRRLPAGHLPLLAHLVHAQTGRYPSATVSRLWQEQLDALPPSSPPAALGREAVVSMLALGGLLLTLPAIVEVTAAPGTPSRGSRAERTSGPAPSQTQSRLLAKVRALLAKAESTEFPEESEALSAKAQQLIAAYALERFSLEVDRGHDDADVPAARRLWIDPPYVPAKAALVNAVGMANHVRVVLSEQLQFLTLVGHVPDLELTELLATSLLVQADRAMLAHGRQRDRYGRSRTQSFRRAFLLAYATRIGERLQEAAEDTLREASRSNELVPVLARADERVRAATEAFFPQLGTVSRGMTVGDGHGWAAGRAAADLATLSVHTPLGEQVAS